MQTSSGTTIRTWVVLAALCATAASACGAEALGEPALRFAMVDPASGEWDRFASAWTAARERPDGPLAYDFPLVSENLPRDATIALCFARYTGHYAGDAIVVAEQFCAASAQPADDGAARFPALRVTSGAATSGQGAIPATYLCGETVVLARGRRLAGGRIPDERELAEAHALAVSEACGPR